MGDALGNFATTGKLNFKGLVTSILGDLAKMEARIALSKILQSVLGAYLGGANYGGGTGAASGTGAYSGFGSSGTIINTYNANGGVYDSPSLSAYSGQVVNRPTPFLFAKGAGIMGEDGPEAIMPLKRGSDGKLGIMAQGGGGIQLSQTFVIDGKGQSTDSATGSSSDDAFRQLATRMKDTAKQAIMEEQRQGGSIWRLMHS
jgi:lambda family phage tail tape measure protein